jgi:hypothetical protein
MFSASFQGLRRLLDHAARAMHRPVFDLVDVLREKGIYTTYQEGEDIEITKKRRQIYLFLHLLPFAEYYVAEEIKADEGYVCCKDKMREIIYLKFIEIAGINPSELKSDASDS